jgi:hypothetical protein
MRNYLANYDQLVVSANLKEAALNTEQTLDTSMLVAMATILGLDPRRESNADELTGKEEPDTVYDLGALTGGDMNFDKAQSQHFGFGYAYALGVPAAGAAWGTGFKHVITPAEGLTLPSFTAAMRIGKTIFKRRFAGMHVDQLTATFAKDSWAKLALAVKGTGKNSSNITKETVNAAFNATTLILAGTTTVQGATPAERLDNVHHIRVQVPSTSQWQDVVFSIVSDAGPAVITIAAPGVAATACNYEIIYSPTAVGWETFPARVSEPPLRVTDLVVNLGGKWDGSALIGGHVLAEEIESIEHVLNNQLLIEYRVGGTGSYANYAVRQGRMQTIRLNRQARDYILQQKMVDNEYFVVYMKATGAIFDPAEPLAEPPVPARNYYVEVVCPRCNVLKAPISVGGKFLGEAGDLVVLQDDTYGSVKVTVGNMVAGYAQ